MRSHRLVEQLAALTSLLMPTNKQPSFAERCRAMQDAAHDLKAIAEVVALEAIHMASAAQRFNERRADKRERRAR
jgi:hypothetical protein